jgi:type IV secretion system protein VirB10
MRIGFSLLLVMAMSGALRVSAQETQRTEAQPEQGMGRQYRVPARTRVPLVLVNSVSTKTAEVGDQVYLQTSFPVAADGRIVIPEGSYVTGTITEVKRPGMVKGRGELYIRFDTLMLRNGVTRDFRGTVSATDGSQSNIAEREGKIEGDSTKGQDVATIAGPTQTGAIIGAVTGEGKGAAIGAGVGAAAGMIGVLLTRGSEVQLLRGTSLEMQLDRDLAFYDDEINFLGTAPPAPLPAPAAPAGSGRSPLERGNQFPFPSPIWRPF